MIFPSPLTTFSKPPFTEDDLIEQWIKRGLVIEDRSRAFHYLRHIGYYRLKGYSRHLTINPVTHELKPGTTFEEVLSTYVFDRKLRLLTLDALERIEVAVKSSFSNIISNHFNNPHWFLERRNFRNPGFHAEMLERCNEACTESSDEFIKSYLTRFDTPSLPPSWMIFEIMSLGAISKAYKNLDTSLKTLVAREYGFKNSVLESWLHSLNYYRNVCAHHGCLWNRKMIFKPVIPDKNQNIFNMVEHDTFATAALMCAYLLESIAPTSGWRLNLIKLIQENPNIDTKLMGFIENPIVIFNTAFPDA